MSGSYQPAVGIFPTTSVRDAAESLAIDKISEETCQAIAGDVEYRLNLIIQEAHKFMRHAKRTTMMPEDIDYALQALNVQPILHPPKPLYKPAFQPVYPPETAITASNPQLYYLKDEEIDLATFLKNAHTTPARATVGGEAGVRWKAHWLAVEGIQPLTKENPISQINNSSVAAQAASKQSSAARPTATGVESLARSHLSQEFQLLFRRLSEGLVPDPALATISAIPSTPSTEIPPPSAGPSRPPPSAGNQHQVTLSESERIRSASLATLSLDPSLSDLVPYLVRWLSENISSSVSAGKEGRSTVELGYLVDALVALVKNPALFIEPYLHQLLPPILSILLSIPLGRSNSSAKEKVAAKSVRTKAADLLGSLISSFSADYETLMPRVARTLTRALASPASIKAPVPTGLLGKQDMISAAGRYEGALLGLGAMGKQTVIHALLGNGGERLRILGGEIDKLAESEREGVITTTIATLTKLQPKSERDDIAVDIDEDALKASVGNTFGAAIARSSTLGEAVLQHLHKSD